MEFFEVVNNLSIELNNFLMNAGMWAPLISSLLIIAEGVLAFLPLVVFVTINVLSLGPVLGGIISWIFTTLGSLLAFLLFRKGFSSFFNKKIENNRKLEKFMNSIDELKFRQLVLIIAIPFAPSFFINLGAGLSNIALKKYFYALLLGKVFVIIFLGYIGSNIIDCFTNPIILIKVIVLILLAYILAQVVNKKFDLDGRF
ncbi:MAG TPA: TVP38/TMEM64 family protein [Candidatus Coprovivens excrementavium]|nr:TVP38/TMEM64 family protein [Candidatus Coprovivens excrementavium]